MQVVPAPILTTKLVIGEQTKPRASPIGSSATDWLSGFFAPRKQQQLPETVAGVWYEAFNEKTFQARMEEQGRVIEADTAGNGGGSSYYR